MIKHIRNLTIIFLIAAIGAGYYFSRSDVAQLTLDETTGPKPTIGGPRSQVIPTINVAEVDRWKAGEKPVAAAGLKVESFAVDLEHPRNLYVLPNGDILVAETSSPTQGSGITGMVAKRLMTKAGANVPSANRITLLRDSDGDGTPETKTKFITGLNAPFGMALVGDILYVANTDAVLAFPYKNGDTAIAAKGKKILDLNAQAPNMHWTRNLAASPDGKKLYVAVGSNSNVADDGMKIEKNRAMVIEIDLATGKSLPFATGMRNPVGMAWTKSGDLWAVVNERDMLGSDLVPDYLGRVEFGADYGWPQHYWGGYTDHRVYPKLPEKRQYERRPDYALGSHVAPLGLAFADSAKLGDGFASGAFVARHGSWNRVPVSGYDVIFVRFENDLPVGKPVNVLNGFLDKDGKAQGRPTMVAIDNAGGLLVSDDVGNRIWRVTAG